MSRIVNGEIVRDPKPSNPYARRAPQPSVSGVRSPFPTTNGKFGQLSDKVTVFNIEFEIIWAVVFLLLSFIFGVFIGLAFIGLLFLYKNNTPQTPIVNRLNQGN